MSKIIDGEKKTKTIETTVGRIIYNQGIPQDLGFVVRPAEPIARTVACPGCFASLRSEQEAAPLATPARLSLPTLQRKPSADADNFHCKVRTTISLISKEVTQCQSRKPLPS